MKGTLPPRDNVPAGDTRGIGEVLVKGSGSHP